MNYYTTESAYHHSFPVSSTGRYAIDLVRAGWDPRCAIGQASIAHGEQQAREFAAACRGNLPSGWRAARKVSSWLRVAERALAEIERIEATMHNHDLPQP